MVSSYVYDMCKDYLDKFLFDFDKSQLSIGILSGNITLRDVNLRPDELNEFFQLNKLPVTLRAGFASQMALTFSVISFYSQPIEIEFNDLSLVFGPSLHHMSNDSSFMQRRQTAASHRSDMEQADSESSYDSTNAFNVHSHSLKNQAKQREAALISNRSNFEVQSETEPIANQQKHKTWKEHQKFLQKLRLAKVMEQRNQGQSNARNAHAGLEAFDFQVDEILNEGADGGEDDEEQNLRSMLGQIQIKINGLHLRFEEDYFSAEKPYSLGLIADQFNLKSSPQGQEIWHFPDFLQNLFNKASATAEKFKQSSQTQRNQRQEENGANELKLGDLIFKEVSIKNMRIYVNTPSEIFVPTLVYDESKHLPKQIFEILSPQYLRQLMSRRQGLNFIIDPIDIIANLGDAKKEKAFLNVISGDVKLNISEPVLTTLLTFKNYIEDIQIVQKLKQYRPQRRPITDSALEMQQYRGKDVQELPENVRRKRKLLVRDWFYYAVWYVRLRNVERKRPTAWDRLCKAQLAHDPDRYRDLIRAASENGVKSMKDWLRKEEHVKRQEQKERAELFADIPYRKFDEVKVSLRLESLNVQVYEKAMHVGIGFPLFDLKMNTLAYEKHLQRSLKKLGSRLAIGNLTLKQVHTMESDVQLSPQKPFASNNNQLNRNRTAQSNTVLSQILRNDRKMTSFNTRIDQIQSPMQSMSRVTETSASQGAQQQTSITSGVHGQQRSQASFHSRLGEKNRSRLGNLALSSTMSHQTYPKRPSGLANKPPIKQSTTNNKLSNVLSAKYGTSARHQTGHASVATPDPAQARGHNSLNRNHNNHAHENVDSPQIASQAQMPQRKDKIQAMAGPTSKGLPNSISPSALLPCRRGASPQRLGFMEEGTLPRGSRFLTLLELSAPRNMPVDYQQNGGLPGCCLDFLYEVPRFSNVLDQMAPLACLPTGLASLTRHMKIGMLKADQTHTDQLLEAITKFYANYAWCIGEIYASPNLLEPLFNISMSDWEDLFNKQMHIHVVERYLWSKRSERDAQVKKIKFNSSQQKRERSAQSNDSQVLDGVTQLGSTAKTTFVKVKPSRAINVPQLGTKASPLNQERGDISGEENLTDDAIKEIDHEFNKINSAQRNSERKENRMSSMEMRQLQSQRERKDLVHDSPVLKAMFELIPRTPVDFRVIMSLHEAQISVFSNHVPVMRVNITAPTTISVTKESQMSSFQIGALQSYFLSEPEMLFAFVKTLNAHMQGIFLTPMLRTEYSLQRLRSLIQDQLKAEHKVKKARTGNSYNMLFNDLADDQPDQSHQYQHMRNNSSTLKIPHQHHQQREYYFEEQDKLPPVIVTAEQQHATVGTPSMQGSWTQTMHSPTQAPPRPSQAAMQQQSHHVPTGSMNDVARHDYQLIGNGLVGGHRAQSSMQHQPSLDISGSMMHQQHQQQQQPRHHATSNNDSSSTVLISTTYKGGINPPSLNALQQRSYDGVNNSVDTKMQTSTAKSLQTLLVQQSSQGVNHSHHQNSRLNMTAAGAARNSKTRGGPPSTAAGGGSKTAMSQREPLNDLAQNKRGLFQKQLPVKRNMATGSALTIEEEKKGSIQKQQVYEAEQHQHVLAIRTMSSEGLQNEEDLDEKCIPSQLVGYQVKHRQQEHHQFDYSHHHQQQQRPQVHSQRQTISMSDSIQPPKVSHFTSMMSGKPGQQMPHSQAVSNSSRTSSRLQMSPARSQHNRNYQQQQQQVSKNNRALILLSDNTATHSARGSIAAAAAHSSFSHQHHDAPIQSYMRGSVTMTANRPSAANGRPPSQMQSVNNSQQMLHLPSNNNTSNSRFPPNSFN